MLRRAAVTLSIFWFSRRSCKQICYEEEKKEKKGMENPGIDPGTSRMQSGRSTFWANPPIQSKEINKTKQNKTILEYMFKEELSKLTLFLSYYLT